jgi:hypothetical protein
VAAPAVDEDADEYTEQQGTGPGGVEGCVGPARDHIVNGSERHGIILAEEAEGVEKATVA